MSESEVKEDDNETEHNSTTTPNPSEMKKKRKKRKKRSGKQGGYHRSSEDNADVCKILHLFPSLSRDACAPSFAADQYLSTGMTNEFCLCLLFRLMNWHATSRGLIKRLMMKTRHSQRINQPQIKT